MKAIRESERKEKNSQKNERGLQKEKETLLPKEKSKDELTDDGLFLACMRVETTLNSPFRHAIIVLLTSRFVMWTAIVNIKIIYIVLPSHTVPCLLYTG